MIALGKIISGGQTGADRAGLEAALTLGISIGGYCPKGRRSEDGRIPQRYTLTEMHSSGYEERTRKNVAESDVTIVFTRGPLTPGSRLTLQIARQLGKPALHVDLDAEHPAAQVQAFLEQHQPGVLNVAGSRESRADGIFDATRQVLLTALSL